MNENFSIVAYKPPSTEGDIIKLKNFSVIDIPNECINIIKEKSEIEVSICGENYIRIWGAAGCIEMNGAYNIQEYLSNSLAIGDEKRLHIATFRQKTKAVS